MIVNYSTVITNHYTVKERNSPLHCYRSLKKNNTKKILPSISTNPNPNPNFSILLLKMTSKEEGEKSRGIHVDDQSQHHYGTFQGIPPPYSQPSIGFPQPVPPPGLTQSSPPPPPPYYAHQGYQGVPVSGYAVAEGRPLREHRLPCCGCGVGWFLFIIGFFSAAIAWYIGAFILLFVRIDYREKAGLVACTIAAVLAAIAITIGATHH